MGRSVLVIGVVGAIMAPAARAADPGTPFAWGANGFGQLGDGTTTAHLAPAPVSLSGVVDLAGGREHAVALMPDGRVYAWGQNDMGQLGDGTITSRPTPTLVPGITDVADVATGHYHTLAIRNDGTLWGWGYNGLGQLGDGSTTNRRSPVRVGTLTGVVATAGGRSMSYATLTDGTLWAWGDNANGQLGDGTRTRRLAPVRVSSLTNVVAVAGGRDHGLAVRSDGSVWAWGDNAYGQLGDGTLTDRSSPIQVPGLAGIVAVTAGAHHSVALRADGAVFSWGRNNLGQLGDGTATQRRSPVPVGGLSGVASIGAGRDHTLAVLADGTVRAWGLNDSGQIGDGTTTNRRSPTPVAGLSGVVDAHGGRDYSVVHVVDGPPDNTPPSPPGTPAGTSTTPGEVALIWGAALDDVSSTLTYHVLRDGVPAGTVVSSSSSVAFTDVGLQPGSTHTYTVFAEDQAGNEGAPSEPSAPITVVSGPSAIFVDDFSSGTLANWSAVTRFSIDGATGSAAPPSARASVSGQSATMIHDLGAGYASICVSARLNVSARTGSIILWRLRTVPDGPIARVIVNTSGILAIRSDVSGITRTSTTALGTGWHTIELCGSVGAAGTWDLYRDGVAIITGWVANTGTAPAARLELGNTNPATWTANFDDVRVDLSAG